MPSASAACSMRQAGEVAELDQLGAWRVLGGQLGQAPRPGPAARRRRRGGRASTSSRSTRCRSPPCFEPLLAAGAARRGCGAWPRRRRRRSGRGCSSAGPCSASDQPQVGLVDQGRGLERLAGLLLGQPLRRQLAQLVVDQRQQLLGGVRVALLDGGQDARDVVEGSAMRG